MGQTMMERVPAMTMSTTAAAMPSNMCVLPSCEIRFEKCEGGLKIFCDCDNDVACGTLQNLCTMLQGGLCACCCTWNGSTVFQCNLCCGHTKCEMTKQGCCITCTSGDKACCAMLQACCDNLQACCDAGCKCCISFGGTPICCSACA